MKYLLLIILAAILTACGSTEPSNTQPRVKVRTQGYLAGRRMSITDFEAKGLDGRLLTFTNGLDTLTEPTAASGFLLLHSDGAMAVNAVDSIEPTTITVPSDTADSAAYKTFYIPDNAINCVIDSNAPLPLWHTPRVFLVDSVTNAYSDFFAHDSTDPSGSQFFVTIWLRDTTAGNSHFNQSVPVEFRSTIRLELNWSNKWAFDLQGTPPSWYECRFTAQP